MVKKKCGNKDVETAYLTDDVEKQPIRANVDIFTDNMFFSELRMQKYLQKRDNILYCKRMHSRCSYCLEMEVDEGKEVDLFLRRMTRYVPGIVSWRIGIVGSSVL